MIRKNIRTLFALGATFINIIITDVNAYYLQVEKGVYLNSFDQFYCDKNPNATSADFHKEPWSTTSVANRGLPESPDHIVHQFGKKLLIIPGNIYQDRMVCDAETEKERFFRKVVLPQSHIDEPEDFLSRVWRHLTLSNPAEMEEVLKQQFWWELVDISDNMMANADASSGADEADGFKLGGSGDHGSPHDRDWGKFFPGFGGSAGDDSDDDDQSPDGGGSFLIPSLVQVKPGGAFFEDFGGFWFPKSKEKKRAKKTKKINMLVVPSGDNSDTSPTIEVTTNPVVENLTIIQFALLVGGFEVNGSLHEQLMNLDELSGIELEQLADGFSTTIINLDSLIENNAIQTPGLSNEQLNRLLLKIEALIRELVGVRDSQNNPDMSRNLQRIRSNLQDLISSRLMSTMLGTSEMSVSGGASQHELLVRVLLESDTDDLPETDDVDIDELQDLVDEQLRRIRSGITGEELIRALIDKIEAIQRQIARRETNLSEAHGSWLRALRNRLETLSLELAASEQSLAIAINEQIHGSAVFVDPVTGETFMPEPEDHGGKGGGAKGDTKSNPPSSDGNTGGKKPQQGTQPPPSKESEQNSSDDSNGDEPDDDDQNDGATAGGDWKSTKTKRDMAVWFADLIRTHSLNSPDRLDVGSTIAGALLQDLESKPDKAREIKTQIRALFEQQYPGHQHLLPENDSGEYLSPYVLAMLKVMRGVALANILFNVADSKELENIRETYGFHVRGERGKSVKEHKSVSFPNSAGWQVSAVHNGKRFSKPVNPVTGNEEPDTIAPSLERLNLAQLLRPQEDGLIHISEADQRKFAEAFLNHPDAGRTPVQFRFHRVINASRHPVVDRKYDLHMFEDLRDHLPQRFPAEMIINGAVNPDYEFNSALAQASQRGGIEDSIQLILNQNHDAAALLHWLFSPNNSVIPLASMMFGGIGDNGEGEITGILQQQLGLPAFSPRSSDQRDLSTQNCEVTVFSNGRMRVHYTVSYDRISRQTAQGGYDNYDANFTLELMLDFDISRSEGVELLHQEFSYKGKIKSDVQAKLEADIKKGETAKDQKIIDSMKKLPDELKEYLDRYDAQKIATINDETALEWRNYAVSELKHAISLYQSLLANIQARKLWQRKGFGKVQRTFDKDMNKHRLMDRLMAAVKEFLKLEAVTYEHISGGSEKLNVEQQLVLEELGREDLSYAGVNELFENHRTNVQNVLAKLQQIKEDLEFSRALSLSSVVSMQGQIKDLSQALDDLDGQYNDRNGVLPTRKKELSKAGANVQAFDVFGPVNALMGAARLHVVQLQIDLGGREEAAGNGRQKGNKRTENTSASSLAIHQVGKELDKSEKPKRNWRSIVRLFNSGNTSPATNSATTSGSGAGESVGNLLDVTEFRELEASALTERGRYQHQRTQSGDMSSALAVVPGNLRTAHSLSELSRHNVRRVLMPPSYYPPSSGMSSPETALAQYLGGVSPENPANQGHTLGPQVYLDNGSSSSLSSQGPTSLGSGHQPNSLGSSTSMGSQSGVNVVPVHGRSYLDDRGATHVPMNTLRNRPSQYVQVLDTINSPVGTPGRSGTEPQFTMPEVGGDNGLRSLEQAFNQHQLIRYKRSNSSGAGAPTIIVSPESMPHSELQGHYWQSGMHLELLIQNNVASNALATEIYNQLAIKGMTASDFRDHLSLGGDNDDYDHLADYDGWQAVQTHIGEYLRSGHTITELTVQIFGLLDFNFRRDLERLYNQVRSSRLQDLPRRARGGSVSPGNL